MSNDKLATFREQDLTDDWEVTVCDACNEASCWLGILMCENASGAGIRKVTVKRLREISGEHPSYWAKEARSRVGVA